MNIPKKNSDVLQVSEFLGRPISISDSFETLQLEDAKTKNC